MSNCFSKDGEILACNHELMLNSAPMAVTFFDNTLTAIDCNMEAVKMFGFREKSEYLKHFLLLIPPVQPNGRSSKRLLQEYILESFREGYAKHELIRQKIDGSLMYTEASFVRTEKNGNFAVVGYFRDLSDVYEAMARENEAYETMQIFMDNSPVGMELWNENMEIVDCNRQIVNMFGFSDKNAFLSRIKGAWEGEHITEIFFRQAQKAGFARYEGDFARIDGSMLPCEVRLVRTIRDNLPHIMAYFLDLSDIKKAIDAASEADKRAMLMLNATPLACFLVRENVTALDCNLAAVELFGFENKEDALNRYREIFPTVSPEGEPLRIPTSFEWVNTSEPIRFEYLHVSVSTGEYIPCDVTMVYLDYQNNPIMACYISDLREIKKMIANMRRIEVAEEESRAKSQFLARMSHEIRTPLNAIMGLCDIQLLKTNHPPETEEALLQIRSSSNVLLSIINDILDLSKVEAGKMEIFNKPYELASLIFDTVQLNMMHVNSSSVKFNLKVDENLPKILIGDELRIKQVLNNLLSNAFKYTRDGAVNLSFTMEHGHGDNVVMIVELQDTGQGMTETQLASLFSSEYIRFNEESNRLIEGTGLGMNITNRLINLMNGHITANSKIGVGTTFYIRIPQRIGSRNVLGKSIAHNLQSFQLSQKAFQMRNNFEYEHMPYGKVLVVDDVESNLFVAKGLLVPYGLVIETATSGYECVELIKAGKTYDIIFMDHMMPGLDGIETAKILREFGYKEPIIALTANTILGQAELFITNGFVGFISKPIDVARLNGYLMTFIHDKQPLEVIEAAKKSKPSSMDDLSGAVRESFLRDANRAIEVLEGLMQIEDWGDYEYKMYSINTHGMKSALANVGKAYLSGIAGSLEQAGNDKLISVIRKDTDIFIKDLSDTVKSFTIDEPKEYVNIKEDKRLLRKQLIIIKEACDSYNKKIARTAVEELKEHEWNRNTKEFLDNISANLLHSEFETICDDIDRYMEEFL